METRHPITDFSKCAVCQISFEHETAFMLHLESIGHCQRLLVNSLISHRHYRMLTALPLLILSHCDLCAVQFSDLSDSFVHFASTHCRSKKDGPGNGYVSPKAEPFHCGSISNQVRENDVNQSSSSPRDDWSQAAQTDAPAMTSVPPAVFPRSDLSVSTSSIAQGHIDIPDQSKKVTLKCLPCEKILPSRAVLDSHILGKQHQEMLTSRIRSGIFQCSSCGLENSAASNYLPSNEDDAPGKSIARNCLRAQKVFTGALCTLCDVQMPSPAVLNANVSSKKHKQKVSTAPAGRVFKCIKCKEWAPHIERHDGSSEAGLDACSCVKPQTISPVTCSLCGVKSTSISNLNHHILSQRHLTKLEEKVREGVFFCNLCGKEMPQVAIYNPETHPDKTSPLDLTCDCSS